MILTRPLICFDLETTSLDTSQARIWEIAFQLFEGLFPSVPKKEWELLINPGIPLPPEIIEMEKKHGRLISDEMFQDKPTFDKIGPHLTVGFKNCDYMGKNVRYDLSVLSAEMKRYSIEWSFADAKVICADRLEQLGEPRSLSHLYEKHTGKKLLSAHSAMPDTKATSELVQAQLEKYSILPKDIGKLHEMQWPDFVDTEGKFRFVGDKPICTFGKYRGVEMKLIELNYWNWILKSDFSEEIKQIASNALNGTFPTRS